MLGENILMKCSRLINLKSIYLSLKYLSVLLKVQINVYTMLSLNKRALNLNMSF